jgi:hypothetical protein
MDTYRNVCYVIGGILLVYLIIFLLPYIIIGLAAIGTGYLIQEFTKHNKRK